MEFIWEILFFGMIKDKLSLLKKNMDGKKPKWKVLTKVIKALSVLWQVCMITLVI